MNGNTTGHPLKILGGDANYASAFGNTALPLNHRNAKHPASPAFVYVGHIRNHIYTEYEKFQYDPYNPDLLKVWKNIPQHTITLEQLIKAIVNVGVHEVGHQLGLVSETYLGGENTHHNPSSTIPHIMDSPIRLDEWLDLFKNDAGYAIPLNFNDLNDNYLKWLLP